VQMLWPRAQERLHLRPALDLEDAHRVGALDLRVDDAIVERDPRQINATRLRIRARDLLDAVLDRGEHSQAEEVDLQETGVGAGILVPLAELAPGHRRGLNRDELDERPRRDY